MAHCDSGDALKQSFEEAAHMLAIYSWIYDFPVTRYLQDRVWQHVPADWITFLTEASNEELNAIPFGKIKDDCPKSLCDFINKALHLSLPRAIPPHVTPVPIKASLTRGMCPKKLHEVSHMAGIVHSLCQQHGCQNILDVGSGLGYLSVVLSEQFGYNILGVESEGSRSHGASKRATNTTDGQTKFTSVEFELKDTEESYISLNELLKENATPSFAIKPPNRETHVAVQSTHKSLENSEMVEADSCASFSDVDSAEPPPTGSWCMMGLHCCGDLTPTMLKSFLHTSSITCLVTLSCCYHRMTASSNSQCSQHTENASRDIGKCRYKQFPLSQILKEALKKVKEDYPDWQLNTYALRLAAQETRTRWHSQTEEDHIFHTKNVAYRALMEMASITEDLKIEKMNRKLAKMSDYKDFDHYLDAVLKRISVADDQAKELLARRCRSYHDENQQYFKLVEPITCLQVVLQSVLESLILQDRLAFLQQHCNIHTHILPIFDENISPRNLAIVAWKKPL